MILGVLGVPDLLKPTTGSAGVRTEVVGCSTGIKHEDFLQQFSPPTLMSEIQLSSLGSVSI